MLPKSLIKRHSTVLTSQGTPVVRTSAQKLKPRQTWVSDINKSHQWLHPLSLCVWITWLLLFRLSPHSVLLFNLRCLTRFVMLPQYVTDLTYTSHAVLRTAKLCTWQQLPSVIIIHSLSEAPYTLRAWFMHDKWK